MPRQPSPVVSAPQGYVWGWESGQEAHLFSVGNQLLPLCRAGEFPGGPLHKSYTVGGYSAQPCADCLELAEQC